MRPTRVKDAEGRVYERHDVDDRRDSPEKIQAKLKVARRTMRAWRNKAATAKRMLGKFKDVGPNAKRMEWEAKRYRAFHKYHEWQKKVTYYEKRLQR
jgi:hypothetical protein